MALTKTYTLPSMGNWTATAVDSTGTYEASETSNSASNIYMLHHAQMQIANLKETKGYTIKVNTTPMYSISVDAVNVTADASNPITIKLNGTVTLRYTADGINYKVPTDKPTITGSVTSTWNRISDTECTITLSNPTSNVSFTVEGEAVQSYPVKGQLITMTLGNATPAAGTQDLYRVLSINGSIAEVVAMYDVSTSCYYNSGGTNTYSGAKLDTMLNTTFYSSLSSTAKAAIVDKTITSYRYTYNSNVYNATTHASYADYSTKATHESIGSRHVYALDVEDIENYFGNTFSTSNIWTLFWNTTAAPSTVTSPWLRSAYADDSDGAWRVYGLRGYVNYDDVGDRSAARPALTIDLSKISWN